jgi:hypothetical protein
MATYSTVPFVAEGHSSIAYSMSSSKTPVKRYSVFVEPGTTTGYEFRFTLQREHADSSTYGDTW